MCSWAAGSQDKSRGWNQAWPTDFSQISQLGNLVSSPLLLTQESRERKGWRQGWYLQGHWGGPASTTPATINKHLGWARFVPCSWVCSSGCYTSNFSVRHGQPAFLRKGEQETPNKGEDATSGALKSQESCWMGVSAFQHCAIQGQMNCLFNTVFWKLHTLCT